MVATSWSRCTRTASWPRCWRRRRSWHRLRLLRARRARNRRSTHILSRRLSHDLEAEGIHHCYDCTKQRAPKQEGGKRDAWVYNTILTCCIYNRTEQQNIETTVRQPRACSHIPSHDEYRPRSSPKSHPICCSTTIHILLNPKRLAVSS